VITNDGMVSNMNAFSVRRYVGRAGLLLSIFLWPLCSAELPLTVSSALLQLPEEQRQTQVEARVHATPVRWSAGVYSLNELVGKLHETGNATQLDKTVDGQKKIQVAAQTGDYWQALSSLCAAFDLIMLPGEGMDVSEDSGRFSNRDNNGIPVITTGGPVRLVARPAQRSAPRYISCGSVLAEITRVEMELREGREISCTALIETAFRFEPRIKPREMGTTLMAWRLMEDQQGRKLTSDESARETQPEIAVVQLSAIPDPFHGCTMRGDLLGQMLEPVTLTATMSVGDTARTTLLGQEVSLQFIGENETTAHGQRGPGFSVSVPTAVLGTRPQLRITSGDQSVTLTNQGAHWSGGRIDLFFRGPRQVMGAYDISLIGQAALEQLRIPLRIPVLLQGLSRAEKTLTNGAELQIPSTVSWPAGEVSLQTALAFLNAHNQVLLELGVDEKRTATLPAFSGFFWDGVLTICQAFNLTLLPATQIPASAEHQSDDTLASVSGGPLCLAAPREDRVALNRFQARGLLLICLDDVAAVTKHGFDGILREAEVSYRLRIEPRFDTSLMSEAFMSWSSLGGVAAGKPLLVSNEREPQPVHERGNVRFVRVGKRLVRVASEQDNRNDTTPSDVVAISGLPANPVDLRLHGQLTVPLRRPVRAEMSLQMGDNGVVALGQYPLMIRMFEEPDERGAVTKRAAVALEMASEYVDEVTIELRDAQERSVRSTDNDNHSNGRLRMLWYYPELNNGPYSVVITARERLATLCVPLTIDVIGVQAKKP
jgi:hypothetical protein